MSQNPTVDPEVEFQLYLQQIQSKEALRNKLNRLRGFLQRLSNEAFKDLDSEDPSWFDTRQIGENLLNISVLDWSKDEGACEAAIESIAYLSDKLGEEPKLLDFGANFGDFLLYIRALFHQFKLYGIELQPMAVDVYNQSLSKIFDLEHAEIIDDVLEELKKRELPKVVVGNFFGTSESEYSERHGHADIWGSDLRTINRAVEKHGSMSLVSYQEAFPDPYQALGLDIKEFDVIYMYQFSDNTPIVIDYLAKNCKVGARIIVNYRKNERLNEIYASYPNIRVEEIFRNQCAILEVIDVIE
jgi:tRNA1(Val) A37 N6-methylase TrmN6